MGTAVGAGSTVKVGLAVNTTAEALPVYGLDTFRNIGYVTVLTPPGFRKKVIEQATLSDGTLQFGGGLEAQVLNLSYVRNFGEIAHEDLFTDGRNPINQFRNFQVNFSDLGTEKWEFKAFVSGWEKQDLSSEQAVIVKVTVNVYASILVTP